MNIRFNRLLVVGIVAAAAVLSVTQVAQAGPPPPVVPTTIQVPDGNKVFLVGHAVGVQSYSCNATPSGFVWGFVAPHANLYDDHGKLIITHFAGPTWQTMEGSRVVGQLVDFVTVDPTAIAWLLLSASTTPGPDGDRLVATTFVQRIATTGGLAPPGRRLQRGNGRDRGRGPLHRRLLLLEEDRVPDATPVPGRAGPRSKPQPTTMGGTTRPRSFIFASGQPGTTGLRSKSNGADRRVQSAA